MISAKFRSFENNDMDAILIPVEKDSWQTRATQRETYFGFYFYWTMVCSVGRSQRFLKWGMWRGQAPDLEATPGRGRKLCPQLDGLFACQQHCGV